MPASSLKRCDQLLAKVLLPYSKSNRSGLCEKEVISDDLLKIFYFWRSIRSPLNYPPPPPKWPHIPFTGEKKWDNIAV